MGNYYFGLNTYLSHRKPSMRLFLWIEIDLNARSCWIRRILKMEHVPGRLRSCSTCRLSSSSTPTITLVHVWNKSLSHLILSHICVSPDPVDLREDSDWHYLQLSDPWPDLELFKKLPFDYIIHDPKYEDASLICSHHQSVKSEGQICQTLASTFFQSMWE